MCDVDTKVRDSGKILDKATGTLYGLGIGPGDPELLTVKAVRVLDRVDRIFAPKPETKSSSFAVEIIKDFVKDPGKIEELVFPMTRDVADLRHFWEEAASRVCSELTMGKDAAFVTLGDPFIYSTYNYLLRNIRRLDKNLKIITIPGISSINAASSIMEESLAEGDERFAIMPLPENVEELKNIFSIFDTVVLLKIGKNLDQLIRFLKDEGLDDASYFISRIGTSDQYFSKGLSSLKEEVSGYLSTMIVKCGIKKG